MENLRAFMLVNTIREICAEEIFTYDPADVDTIPPPRTRSSSPAS